MTYAAPVELLPSQQTQTATATNWRLFAVSAAALYLEIVIIRWAGTELAMFAHLQNISLIACFLGFGLGCFSSVRGEA